MQHPPPPPPPPPFASMVGAGFSPSSQSSALTFRCLPRDRVDLKITILARPTAEVGIDKPPRSYGRIKVTALRYRRAYTAVELKPLNDALSRLYAYESVDITCWRDGPEVSVSGNGGWNRTKPRTLVFKVLEGGLKVGGWKPEWPDESPDHP